MNATSQFAQEQSHSQTLGLARVINNSVALVLLDLLNKAIPLIVFPRVVRALGPAMYGRLGFAAAVAGFFGLLASPGFSTYALREAARNSERVPFLVKHVLGARVVFAIGAYALLAIFTLFFAPRDSQTRLLIMLSGLAFVVGSLDTQWIFAARSRMSMIAMQGALAQLAYAGLILALVRGSRDAWIIPSATLLSLVLSTLFIWLPARHQYHIPLPEISPQTWDLFLPVCLVMGFSSLMSMIYDQIDVVMLKYFRADVELGTYVASYGLMTMAMSFLPILGQVFLPLLSETAGHESQCREKISALVRQRDRRPGPTDRGRRLYFGGSAHPVCFRKPILRVGDSIPLANADHRHGDSSELLRSATHPEWPGKKISCRSPRGSLGEYRAEFVFIPRYGALAAAFTTAFSQGVVALMNYYFVKDLTKPPCSPRWQCRFPPPASWRPVFSHADALSGSRLGTSHSGSLGIPWCLRAES